MSVDFPLNPEQRAAVEHPPGPLLVVAGAGSGKTRVLTARIAWLLEQGAPPSSILAFTFTNRAAREMRERIERVVGETARELWVGTFHATAVRILRREARALGLAPGFAIYDREDQEGVIRDVIKRLELPEGQFRVGQVLGRISDAKNALVSPEEVMRLALNPHAKHMAACYALYQGELAKSGAFDFDDLIAGAVRMFRERPDLGNRYSQRFQHVLVDEYQDTNHAQFRLVEALGAVHGSVFAVGDSDQAVYSWRGADLSNILDFEKSFPGAATLRLEQNYRSTGRILAAANAVIANNRKRVAKNLWCEREDGPRLTFVLAEDEVDEARRVRAFLAEHVRRGGKLADCAVLYRTNSQSRALETELRMSRTPYEIVGGISFYQRREVKDLLAYLRLVVNPADAVAFWRIWNTPRRGLGAGVRATVEERMGRDGLAPLAALRALVAERVLTRAAHAGASDFIAIIDELHAQLDTPVDLLFERLLQRVDYLASLGTEEGAEERRANVQELGVAAASFAATPQASLVDFLAETALVSDLDMMSEASDRVLMLTAHNAKGLEFPVVIVTGLEEGLMPHASSLEDEAELEEERRLFYVAITRAQERVILTAAAFRRRYDAARGGAVSRFVGEIPEELLEREVSAAQKRHANVGRDAWDDSDSGQRPYERSSPPRTRQVEYSPPAPKHRNHRALGREVYHEKFGRGVVVEAEGEGEDSKFTVRFGTQLKKVMGRFLTGGGDGD